MSRVTIVETPVAAPGVCILCGTSGGDGRTFVDFGKQLDWYGAVYFCNVCFNEISEAFDYIQVSKFNTLLAKHKQLGVDKDQLEGRFNKLYEAFRSVFDNEPDPISTPSDGAVDTSAESDKLLESIARTTGRESETDESTSVEGSDDVFDASDFDSQ